MNTYSFDDGQKELFRRLCKEIPRIPLVGELVGILFDAVISSGAYPEQDPTCFGGSDDDAELRRMVLACFAAREYLDAKELAGD